MAGAVHPSVALAGDGEMIRGSAGGPTTLKARAETTNGTFTALENIVAPGKGPPLHIHVREDEMYYILDGRLRLQGRRSDVRCADRVLHVHPPRHTTLLPERRGGAGEESS